MSPKLKAAALEDPVAEGQAERDEEETQRAVKGIDELTFDDFQPIPVTASRQPHPFEGYPQRKIRIGTYKDKGVEKDLIVSATHIVALNPKVAVHQDPSGKGQTITSGGVEKTVDIPTTHNRTVKNERGQNEDIVFDRRITLAGGRTMERVALCPDHTARAQLFFRVNKRSGKIEIDDRYVLADTGQTSRLRRLFEMFHYQQTQSERLSQRFDAEPESGAQ